MIERAFRAMSTDWWLTAADAGALEEAERLVHAVEARLSRFRPDSALSRLNARRRVRDPWLAEVVAEALRLREATAGAFDPTLGDALRAAGYDRSFEDLPPFVTPDPLTDRRPVVELDGDLVLLHGPGSLDLGGIAKGWTVDRVAERLGEVFLVDGGGDLRGGGPEPWSVGLPGERAISLRDAAVASSSTQRRRWDTPRGPAHHILSPATGLPSGAAREAVVLAPTATLADVLATALIADPARVVPRLAALGAASLIQTDDWWMTPSMEMYLQ